MLASDLTLKNKSDLAIATFWEMVQYVVLNIRNQLDVFDKNVSTMVKRKVDSKVADVVTKTVFVE